MKNIKILLITALILSVCSIYAQRNGKESPLVKYAAGGVNRELNQKEMISMIEDSYHFTHLRFPDDTTATLDHFISTIDRIVPMNDAQKQRVREQALDAVRRQRPNIPSLSDQIRALIIYSGEIIPLLGGDVTDVIRSNFTESEYQLIFDTIYKERRWALYAENELRIVMRKRLPPEHANAGGRFNSETLYKNLFYSTFEYFKIPMSPNIEKY